MLYPIIQCFDFVEFNWFIQFVGIANRVQVFVFQFAWFQDLFVIAIRTVVIDQVQNNLCEREVKSENYIKFAER